MAKAAAGRRCDSLVEGNAVAAAIVAVELDKSDTEPRALADNEAGLEPVPKIEDSGCRPGFEGMLLMVAARQDKVLASNSTCSALTVSGRLETARREGLPCRCRCEPLGSAEHARAVEPS